MNKVDLAKSRLETVLNKIGDKIFLGHSGGKDSQTILHLARSMGFNGKIVHNIKPLLGTSGDPVAALTEMHPETLNFLYTNVCRKNRVEFLHSSGMEEWVKDNGMLCQIDGARTEEATRAGKSANIIRNGVSVNRALMTEFEPCGIFNLQISYPIYDWTGYDVFDYLCANKVELSREYATDAEYLQWEKDTGRWILAR